jgi:hypothetical protein
MPPVQLAIQFLVQLTIVLAACRIVTLVTTLAAGPLFEWAWRGSVEVADVPGVRAH